MNIVEKITNKENLYWAWEKAKFAYKPGDVWFDEIAIAKFEGNIDAEFNSIINEINSGTYTLAPMIPIGLPKANDSDGESRTRQTFNVNVRDQVVWLAVINIIGQYLDVEMPFWSYGHRLFIPAFYTEENNRMQLRFGRYRNTSKHIYRKWSQSWPMFRKHIALAVKRMANNSDIDDAERELVDLNEQMSNIKQLYCHYITEKFWIKPLSGNVFWAGIDFEKFYPKAKMDVVKKNILKYLPQNEIDEKFANLLNAITSFKIDFENWNDDELEQIQLKSDKIYYDNIPTGLFAAGFLSNVLLLDTDKTIHRKIVEKRNVAHFRFVDDHIILCDDFLQLIDWIKEYIALLEENDTGATINPSKSKPESVAALLGSENGDNDVILMEAETACKLDSMFPSPLMTQTLAKISLINQVEFDLLNDVEQQAFIADIEHLLLADFDDEELRKDTRLSFAATILSRVVPNQAASNDELIKLECDIVNTTFELERLRGMSSERSPLKGELEDKLKQLYSDLKDITTLNDSRYGKVIDRTYKMLLKSLFENFDKIKLWNRTLEFCLNAGYNGITALFEILGKLRKENTSSKLNVIYFKSIIFQIMSNLLLRALHILKSDYPTVQKERSLKFLLFVLDERLLFDQGDISEKDYYRNSVAMFRQTVSVVSRELQKNKGDVVLKKLAFNEYTKWNKISEYDLCGYTVSPWLWWFTNKLKDKLQFPPLVWEENIEDVNGENDIDKAVLSLYPRHFPQNKLGIIPLNTNEGWIFDVIKELENKNAEIPSTNIFMKVKAKMSEVAGYVTLAEWTELLTAHEIRLIDKYRENNRAFFDPRLSEWTSLEIIRQILVILINSVESPEIDFETSELHRFIHPNNFLIPSAWLHFDANQSWHSWDEVVRNNQIKHNIPSNLIFDSRYTPEILDAYGLETILPIIEGVGAIMICLLSKSFELPTYWNPVGHQRVWLGLIQQKLNKSHISSLSSQIIEAIFSKRNRETSIYDVFFANSQFEFSNDTLIDPPRIERLEVFKNLVISAQNILGRYRINVQDNAPRQLIPVSLKQLSTEYKPYDE